MNAVNPTKLLGIGLLTTVLALSGCIEPSDFESWDSSAQSQDHHEHEDEHAHDDWEHDWDDEWCPEEDGMSGHSAANDDGDVDSEDVEDAFEDASPRFSNAVDGDEDSTRTIDVGLGTDELVVGLVYDLHGEFTIRLRNPLGMTVAVEDFDGLKEMYEEEWVVQNDPMPGPWKLSIDIDGHGGYTVGFYLDD